MKAYKLDISEFQVEVTDPSGQAVLMDYGVRPALVGILLNPQLNLTGIDVFDRYDLATRIKTSDREVILLSPEEHGWLKAAIATIKGFGMNDVELIRRIRNAPEIDIEEGAA